jgi:hypothetical protein
MKLNVMTAIILTGAIFSFVIVSPVQAYVTPKIGGGQEGGFPMLMPEIFFNGQSIIVYDESGYLWATFFWSAAPYLRPLIPPDEFDPNKSWKVLIGKAYNFQYGWDSAFLDEITYPFPPGSDVWVKVLNQTPSFLDCYDKDYGYIPIFGTPDACGIPSPDIWRWNKGMRHNNYAVPDTYYGRVSATYKLYLGNALSDPPQPSDGNELVDSNGVPLYGSAIVTFRWLRPCPYVLQGDINSDCIVDFYDYVLLSNEWRNSCSDPYWCDESDINKSTAADLTDLLILTENWLIDCFQTPGNPACVPRPGPI